MPTTFVDHYSVLGVRKSATPNEIKQAYRKLSLRFHPDKNNQDPSFEEKFKRVQQAFSVLSNALCRRQYDIEYEAHYYSPYDSAAKSEGGYHQQEPNFQSSYTSAHQRYTASGKSQGSNPRSGSDSLSRIITSITIAIVIAAIRSGVDTSSTQTPIAYASNTENFQPALQAPHTVKPAAANSLFVQKTNLPPETAAFERYNEFPGSVGISEDAILNDFYSVPRDEIVRTLQRNIKTIYLRQNGVTYRFEIDTGSGICISSRMEFASRKSYSEELAAINRNLHVLKSNKRWMANSGVEVLADTTRSDAKDVYILSFKMK